MSPTPDTALLERIANQDDAALGDLYAAYGQRMMAYALRLTRETATAEDVVQDALVTVWKSARRYRREGSVLAWLLGIVHHTAMKRLRRRSLPLPDDIDERLVGDEPPPDQHVQELEQAEWVRDALGCLSPEHRSALELVFYQGMTLAEAAEVSRCPLGTIKSRLSNARRRMRRILEARHEERWR